MNKQDLKDTMEQIHISQQMQEELIMKIQDQMEQGNKKKVNWKKLAATAAMVAVTAGVVSIPVYAVVDAVRARMEAIPQEEVQKLGDMIQEQNVEADGFSREFSDAETERKKELWDAYENGMFPEKELLMVDNGDEAAEDELCYVKATGEFYLPDREMTDEELLEMIDFWHKVDYSFTQSPAAAEAREEYQAEMERLEEMVKAVNGISGEEAIEIARRQMEEEIGKRAESKELMTDVSGCGAHLEDISEETGYEHKGDVAYNVGFGNPGDHSTYTCIVDAADGSILWTFEYVPE